MIMFSVFITDVLMLHFKDHEVRETFLKINIFCYLCCKQLNTSKINSQIRELARMKQYLNEKISQNYRQKA